MYANLSPTRVHGGQNLMLYLVRHIPTWMPGAGFKRHALKARAAILAMLDRPYELVKQQRVRRMAKFVTFG